MRILPVGILAQKLGMTRLLLEDGQFVPVTVLKAGPCAVTAIRTPEQDGYSAVQLGFLPRRKARVNKPMAGHFSKNNVQPFQVLREFRVEDAKEFSLGQEVKVDDFEEGSLVDVRGVSKGKGFAGTVKRWRFSRGPMSHGSSSHRRPASSGGTDAARVFKGKRGPGHMGNETASAKNLRIVRTEAERGLLFVKGAVPGINGGIVEVRPALSTSK